MYDNFEKSLWIDWNMSGNEIIREADKLIEKSTYNNETLLNLKLNSKDNCNKFLQIISDDVTEYNTFHTMCSFLQFVSPDESVRKSSNTADLLLTKYSNQLNLREDIYNKIVQFYKKADQYIKLVESDIQFFKKIMESYEKNGINLNEKDRSMLLKVKQEISNIENHLSKFIRESENKIIGMTNEELKGLPSYFIHTLPVVSNNPIKYGVTFDKAKYIQYMKYIDDENIRKKLEFFYSSQCFDVVDEIARLIVLRDKYAKLLSYSNHSDYKSFNQVAKNSENIKNFLAELLYKLDFRYTKEISTLSKIKKRFNYTDRDTNEINSWNVLYYIDKWKRKYGLNENEIRKYFPLDHVLNCIFDIYQTLFKIEFVKVNGTSVWHPDVNIYQIYDKSVGFDKQVIGHLYLDLFNRPHKYKNTRCFSLQSASVYPYKMKKYQVPIVALTSSLDKQKNVLLSHSEIISLFHEFGHVIHHIFGKTKYSIFSGTNVELDFVETPAQILENMCWNKHILNKLSSHYKTGEKLSYDIIEKMIRVKHINIGFNYKYNIFVAMYDQLIHSSSNFIEMCEQIIKESSKEYTSDDSYGAHKIKIANIFLNLHKRLHNQVMLSPTKKEIKINLNDGIFLPIEWTNFIYEFDAQQYCYIWSKIYADDVYNNISKRNKLDEKINLNFGIYFKDKILSHGGTRGAMKMLTDFLNRKPNINGFLELHKLETNAEFSFFFNTEHTNKSNIAEPINISDSSSAESETNNVNTIGENNNIYSNRFSEINPIETIDTIEGNNKMDDSKKIFIKDKLKNHNDYYVTENTESLAKYKKIFIKN
jgi:Zn-dependent oligopeptidase